MSSKKLKDWGSYSDDIIGNLIFSTATVDEDENDGDYNLSNGFSYPQWALKSRGKVKVRETYQLSTTNDEYVLTFEQGSKTAEFKCGDKIDLTDLVKLGEVAQKFLPKKKATKKKVKRLSKKTKK